MTPTPEVMANDLLGIHHHDDVTGKIFYYQDDLLKLFIKWGWPEPDWEGNAQKLKEMQGQIMAAILDLHPSKTIKELMAVRDMDEEQLAAALKLTKKGVLRILDYGGAFSPATATALEQTFGIPAEKWLKMQDVYLTEFDRLFSQNTH